MTDHDAILVVDDTRENLKLLVHILTEAGYRVRPANSGELALAAIDAERPALILLDVRMPGMDGYAVCRQLKAREETRDIPIIFISASTEAEERVVGFQLGGVDFVTKPFQKAELLARVQTHLALHRNRLILEQQTSDLKLANEQHFLEIEAHKQSNIDLIESKTLTDAIVENIPLMIFLKEATDLRFVIFNRAGEELLGYDRTALLGRNNLDLFPPEQAAHFMAKDREVLEGETGSVDIPEEPISTAHNGERLLHTRKVRIIGADGTTKYLLGVSEDITDRKQHDLALHESEIRYRRLFESAKDGILILDEESGVIVDVNPFLLELLAYTKDEVLGKKLWMIGLFSDLAENEEAFVKLQETKYIRYDDLPLQTRDGRVIDVEFVSNVYEVNNSKVIQCNIRDITERKQAKEALRERELEFHSLAEAMPQMVWITRPDGWNIYFNQQWMDYTGLTLEESYGHGWNKPFHPDDQKRAWDAWQKAINNDTIYSLECRLRRADGVYRWWLIRGMPQRNSHGTILKWFGTCTDINDIKQAELDRGELEEQVRRQQRLETVGQLAAGVAHDFNNLLTGIAGFTQFAYDAISASAVREDLTEVLLLANRATDLTRQLLAFSRRQTLQPIVLDINAQILELIKMLKRLIGEHINLIFHPAPDLGVVKVDPGQFDQILMNLVVNARDAMPDGGQLVISTANIELDNNYVKEHLDTAPGRYVMIAVTDNGCGMEKSVLDHMFEPFFSTKDVGKGTGLGLATVYGIVKQHGGSIWVYSEPGVGTTFKIYLPHIEKMLDVQHADIPTELAGGTETILLVEDEGSVREVAMRILQQHGYTVFTAALPSLADDLLALHGEDIKLIITDMVMPERNGLTLYQDAHKRYPHLRVIYMSGYTEGTLMNNGFVNDDFHYIQKPFTTDTLLQTVRQVLDETPHD